MDGNQSFYSGMNIVVQGLPDPRSREIEVCADRLKEEPWRWSWCRPSCSSERRSVQWIGDDEDMVTEWRRRCSAVMAAVLPVAHSATLEIG
jgi:uncharacterized protein YmfQ (DUF2313 family)